ncbi:MAG: guanylate kinase [Candidatus Cloacimonadota bacterium]|nr:MAG: guanylate kinase [Candidatus Cloacimonadota bacterium]
MKIKYKKKNFLIVLIAPSGGGKSTILSKIIEKNKNIVYSVSYTTRPVRGNEKNGVDYFFVSEEEFLKLKEQGEFLETAKVHGNYYGTSKSYIEKMIDEGKHVIMDIDVQGADAVIDAGFDNVSIFILPPTEDVLKKRLTERGTDSSEAIEVRLKNSKKEIEKIPDYQYLIINDELETAIEEISYIIKAEENKTKRYLDTYKKFYGE